MNNVSVDFPELLFAQRILAEKQKNVVQSAIFDWLASENPSFEIAYRDAATKSLSGRPGFVHTYLDESGEVRADLVGDERASDVTD